jgi:hypothetical protein
MGAASLREAANDGVFGGIEEDDASGENFANFRQDRGKTLEAAALAHVDDQCSVRNLGGFCDKVGEARDEFEWEVVDGVEAEVFEGLERGGLAGTREAGKDNQLARLTII